MGVHIAQIGTGRVGRPTAYTIMCSGLASKLTVCDIKPGLAKAFSEELRHVSASLGIDIEIIDCERDEDVTDADIILVSAGESRQPGIRISRRDLVMKNANIIRYIAETTGQHNHHAKYVIITNPVDAMAMVFQKYSGVDFVLSSGTNLESLRLRSELAKIFKIPVSKIQGWVGGEHGDSAVILWSSIKIDKHGLEEFVASNKSPFDKNEIAHYVKAIPEYILDNIGATEYGPAASFRDIVQAIVQDTREILAVATPRRFDSIPLPVHVSVPLTLGSKVGPTLFETLPYEESQEIENAAKVIYNTYQVVVNGML